MTKKEQEAIEYLKKEIKPEELLFTSQGLTLNQYREMLEEQYKNYKPKE